MFPKLSQTIFSRTFEINGRFDTCLKCFRSFVSSPGFFKSGITTACLNCLGTVPVEREALIIAVTNGTKSCRHCFMREVGIRSNMQLLVEDRTVSSLISFSVTGSKWESMGPLTLQRWAVHMSESPNHHADCVAWVETTKGHMNTDHSRPWKQTAMWHK